MRLLIFFLLCSMACICCKKNNTPAPTPIPQMKVMEQNSTTPISDVKVDFYRCTGGASGCTGGQLFHTAYTDNNGILKDEQFNYASWGITLSKNHYITAAGGTGDRYMYRAGYIRMRLIKTNSYPDTAAFTYHTVPTLNSGVGWYQFITPPPNDTTINLELADDTTYTVYCGVVVIPRDCVYPCASGTLLSDNTFSLRLGRFGDTAVTIRY